MGNRKYCYLYVIADTYSRYIVTAKGPYGERFTPVKE